MSDTKVWTQYQNGLSYQSSMGFSTDFPLFVRFKEGDQWPVATGKTRNLPRPVLNLVKMFIRTKRAAVLNQPISINYSPDETGRDDVARELAAQGASDFTDYARQLWKRCKQDTLNSELVDDAATLGTGILHYYMDYSVAGGVETSCLGEIRGECIDPLNIFVSEPQVRDIQKQEWIIIAQRVSVNAARHIAENYKVDSEQMELIRGDNDTAPEGYDNATKEMRDEQRCTLLLKYYRDESGKVVFDRCTRKVMICKGQSLTPDAAPCDITLYPIAVFNWEVRKKCLWGIGEAQSMIPAQKAVNFLKAMELLSAQQTAWPKLVARQGALRQPITNEPGEVITDYGQGGNGLYYLAPPVMSPAASALSESLIALMRMTSGVNEASTGESMGASVAASAIIALQAQAKTPIEEIQKRFWICIEDVGRIWEQLIKSCYAEERTIIPDSPTEAEDDESRLFSAEAYSGVAFRLNVDVGASSEYGEVLAQATLDKMLDRGDITIDQYVELAPRNVVPFKERFKQMRKQSGQAAAAYQQQAMMMAQSGAPLPEGAAVNTESGLPTPEHMTRPTGVGGVTLPSVPTAPNAALPG